MIEIVCMECFGTTRLALYNRGYAISKQRQGDEGVNPAKLMKIRFLCRNRLIRYGATRSQNILSLAQLETLKKEVERGRGRAWALKIMFFFF